MLLKLFDQPKTLLTDRQWLDNMCLIISHGNYVRQELLTSLNRLGIVLNIVFSSYFYRLKCIYTVKGLSLFFPRL